MRDMRQRATASEVLAELDWRDARPPLAAMHGRFKAAEVGECAHCSGRGDIADPRAENRDRSAASGDLPDGASAMREKYAG